MVMTVMTMTMTMMVSSADELEEDFDKRLAENEKDGEVKISAEERATKDYMSIQEAENLGCKGTMLQSYMYYSMNLEYTKIRYTLKM